MEWLPIQFSWSDENYQAWMDYIVKAKTAVFGLSPEDLGLARPRPRGRFDAVAEEISDP